MNLDHEATPRTATRLALFAALGLLPLAAEVAAEWQNVGLSYVRARRFDNEAMPPYGPQAGDQFGWSLATGDFDGDGTDDLATGIPFDDCLEGSGPVDCGSVVVRYGIPGSGLGTGLAEQILNQQESGHPELAEVSDQFGWALAACDLNGDGFDDLAVGVPLEDLPFGLNLTIVDSGVVAIYYGTAAGLATPATTVLSSNGIQAAQQQLGFALACGDFDLDGFDDLVVGVPGAVVNNLPGAGKIRVYPGSPTGVGAGPITIHQDTLPIEGIAEAGDRFGEALAVGDFDRLNTFYPDLAIGAPGENEGAGAVHWIRGSFGGLDATFNFVFDLLAFGADPEAGDRFGHALAAGDFDGDSYDDLAIGVPHDDQGALLNTGSVFVAYGQSTWALNFVHTQSFDQDGLLGADHSESNDEFGWALASGDFDGDGRADLAIGHPFEDITGGPSDGAVSVTVGAPFGFSGLHRRLFASGADGIPGSVIEHHRRGRPQRPRDRHADGEPARRGRCRCRGRGLRFSLRRRLRGRRFPLLERLRPVAGGRRLSPFDSACPDRSSPRPAAPPRRARGARGTGGSMRFTGFGLLGTHFLATASSFDGLRALGVAAMVWIALADARPASALDSNVGLSSVRAQRFGRADLPNANAAGNDRFSFAFAVGDFDGDGASDLASGAPTSDGASATPVDECGQVVVRYGRIGAGLEEGLAPVALGQFLGGGFPEAGDLFGRSLAACDLDGDGFDDLAVGVPLEDLTLGLNLTIVDSGVVEVYYGSSAGLAPPAGAVLSNNSIQAAGQRLGWVLACGDFDGDGFDDLVAGIPGGVVDNLAGAGRIRVWPGSPTGVGTACRVPPRPGTRSASSSPSAISTTTASPTSRSPFPGRSRRRRASPSEWSRSSTGRRPA